MLAGSSHWSGLESWIRAHLLEGRDDSPEDVALLTVADDPDEIADIVAVGRRRQLQTYRAGVN